MDTRVKIVGMILATTFMIGSESGLYLSLVVLGISLVTIFALHLFKPFLVFIRALSVFLLIVIAFQTIRFTGLDYEGLQYGLLASLRLVALASLSFLFLKTTTTIQIIQALSFLPPSLRATLLISFKLFAQLPQLFSTIRIAQMSRGHTQSVHIIRSFIPLLVPLIVKSMRQAEKTMIALETRGYSVQ